MKEPAIEPLILLEDEPVRGFGQDELGLKGFSRTVAGAVLGSGGPFTIGVYGGWGQGKTSVLKQARSLLDQLHPDTTVTVFFNAWQFEREREPLVPLVATIIREVHSELQKRKRTNSDDGIKAWLQRVESALSALLAAATVKLTLPLPAAIKAEIGADFGKAIETYKKLIAEGKPVVQPTMYLEAFAALDDASQFRGGANKIYQRPRIVIFVDDLDRCLPPRALRVLECIKLVLAHPGFIFVLAVNRRVVEGYLEHRFASRFGIASDPDLGRRYLDKIVQLPLPVPMHRPRFAAYIQGLLQRESLKAPSNQPVRAAIEALAEVLGVGSAYTPRRLVRFINNLIIDQALRRAQSQPVDEEWLEFCAVNRMVGAEFDEQEHQQLIDDEDLCKRVVGHKETTAALKELTSASGGPLTAPEMRRQGVLQRVLRSDVLRSLFDTDAGKSWLANAAKRREVHEFVASTKRMAEREQAGDEPEARKSPTVPAEILAAIADAEKAERTYDPRSVGYWVTIPPGEFRMGSEIEKAPRSYDAATGYSETPPHVVTLRAYRIGQFPVTVSEYEPFVAEGYADERHWGAGGFGRWERPVRWDEQIAYPNRPVTGVNWYEATAYAAWAGHRLPSEAEWERAARGPQARLFPWGNESADPALANYGLVIGCPTPVGIYARGLSAERVADMAGNVWEWCQDDWHPNYEGAPADGSAWIKGAGAEGRVRRGGSWGNGAWGCRGACRLGVAPDDRYEAVGFRLASEA